MNMRKFEEDLGDVIKRIEEADVEGVANLRIVYSLCALAIAAVAAGFIGLIFPASTPNWLDEAGFIGANAFGILALLFNHYHWFGR